MVTEVRITGAGRRRAATRHPWVFRDHVAAGEATPGALVRVLDPAGRQVGHAAWSPSSRIALRFLAFGENAPPPDEAELYRRFAAAVLRRAPLAEVTDAVRLVSSEADGLPGLIVDRYADAVVVQALTAFADYLIDLLPGWLAETVAPRLVLARNDGAARELEGLAREVRLLAGDGAAEATIREGDLRFTVDLEHGQKTGLFLDQRANRIAAGRLVPAGARVLDVFSYVGGFALHAAARAAEVIAIEESAAAAERIALHAGRNGLENVRVEKANAFKALRARVRDGEQYDVVILDPPAFAKNRREVDGALRGYGEINLRALRLLRPGGLLVTSSCSHHVGETLFEDVLRDAAADAGRDVVLRDRRGQDVDHPVLLALPESRYLKCFILEAR